MKQDVLRAHNSPRRAAPRTDTPRATPVQDVLRVPNSPFVFVHESHPAINLLRLNKHITGVDIDAIPKVTPLASPDY